MMRSRAFRRYEEHKAKERCKNRLWYIDFNDNPHLFYTHYRNRKKCSCDMCGNPRKVGWHNHKERITIQERISEINEQEQRRDLAA